MAAATVAHRRPHVVAFPGPRCELQVPQRVWGAVAGAAARGGASGATEAAALRGAARRAALGAGALGAGAWGRRWRARRGASGRRQQQQQQQQQQRVRSSTQRVAAAAVDDSDLEFDVTPWAGDADSLPIFACSDTTGAGAKRLVNCTWAQFGFPEAADVSVRSEIRTAEDVEKVVAEAAGLPQEDGGMNGALLVYTLASQELSSLMADSCQQQGVPCIDALQPLLAALEECLRQKRQASKPAAQPQQAADAEVFVVSDSSGKTPTAMVTAALQQFPGSGVDEVTVCPEVRTVEEVKQVVEAAQSRGSSLVAFTSASSGLARFMRQQCEEAGVRYVDLFQPVLLAFESYLQYPAIGVPGGYLDSKAPSKWRKVKVEREA